MFAIWVTADKGLFWAAIVRPLMIRSGHCAYPFKLTGPFEIEAGPSRN